MFEHGRIGSGEAGEEPSLFDWVVVPRLDHEIAVGEFSAAGHDPQLDLALQPIEPGLVPALGEYLVVLIDQMLWRLMRSVTGTRHEHEHPGCVRNARGVSSEHLNGIVGEVLGHVVAGLVVAGYSNMAVVAHHFGGVLVGFSIEESVEPIETAPERPAVERPGRARLGEWRDMPLA